MDRAENVLAFGNPGSGKSHLLYAIALELVYQGRRVLFPLLSHRYERGSVMVTANFPFSERERIFKDPMATAAAIDRLEHHSVILELNIPSYRLEHAQSHQGPTDSPGEAK